MGREIRRVPKNWKHPKIIKGYLEPPQGYVIKERYRPMYDHTTFEEAVQEFNEEVKEWLEGYENWKKGFYINYEEKKETIKQALKRWEDDIMKEREKYQFTTDYKEEELRKYKTGVCSYSDIAGDPPRYPNPELYMPTGKWYQLFENVSEGTPLSPPFEKPEELVNWLENNKDYWGNQWSREQAEAMIKAEWSPSFVMSAGKLYNSQEATLLSSQ